MPRPPKTETGDDPIDAILHAIEAQGVLYTQLFEAFGQKVEALIPAMKELSRGMAEEKNIVMVAHLNNVRQVLEAIEQLPNIDAHERGPLAREAIAMIDEALK